MIQIRQNSKIVSNAFLVAFYLVIQRLQLFFKKSAIILIELFYTKYNTTKLLLSPSRL